MKKLLLVEDSILFGSIIIDKLKSNTDYEIVWTKSLAETVDIIEKECSDSFFASILDFKLPDAFDGEIIDAVSLYRIPVIVFTGYLDKNIRDLVWSKSVVDYVLKEDHQSIDYIISLLKRIESNPSTKIIVTDSSLSFQKIISNLLNIHQYNVITANNGFETLKLIDENPDTKLVVTGYKMADMDGLELTLKIREKYNKDAIAIIGISSEDTKFIAPRFLKYGANDFIARDLFTTEEFYRRITQNIENLEHIQLIKDASIKDYLTGLFNRRYFFEFGQNLVAKAMEGNITLTCAMMDIDYFKHINDTYGHKAGDSALKTISSILKKRGQDFDIVSRFGGDEFCILSINLKPKDIRKIFENLCEYIRNTFIDITTDKSIKITVSIGICTKFKNNLDELILEADNQLYIAKKEGRNRISLDND